MKYTSFILFIIIFLTGCKNKPTEPSFEQYINVPGDYSNIQSAIDASVNGDTILVEPGTYYENINFNDKNITLASRFIFDENEEYISNTIVDGEQKGSVVTFKNGETNNTTLIGFTIQNGHSRNSNDYSGGGIFCLNSNPILNYLIITNNYAPSVGGGISVSKSHSLINNCVITNNEAGMQGAGIYIWKSLSIEITNTRISNNFIDYGDPNADILGQEGAGIYTSDSEIYLSNVSIHNNYINNKYSRGAGIFLYGSSKMTLNMNNRCNIYSNTITFGDQGVDICLVQWNTGSTLTEMYLDTFTVMNPNGYYAFPIENFTFDILNSIE